MMLLQTQILGTSDPITLNRFLLQECNQVPVFPVRPCPYLCP